MKPEHENIEYCANLFAESLFCNPDNNIFHESTRSVNCITRYQILNGLHSVLSNKPDFPQSVKIKGTPSVKNLFSILSALYIGRDIDIENSHTDENNTENETYPFQQFIFDSGSRELEHGVNPAEMREIFIKNSEKSRVILYTSGSTGTPKKIVLSAYSLLFQAVNISTTLRIKSNDRQLFYMPVGYVYGLSVMLTGIYSGSCLVESEYSIDNPKAFFSQIIDKRITIFSGIPYIYKVMNSRWSLNSLKDSSLLKITQAGGLLETEIKSKFLEFSTKIELWIMYGQTEFGGRISMFNQTSGHRLNPCGHLLPGIKLQTQDYDEEDDNINRSGEIYISSPSQALNIEELTGKVNINGTYYYSTGDRGFLKDDILYITGRNTSFIKVAGKRINTLNAINTICRCEEINNCIIAYDDKKYPIFILGVDVSNSSNQESSYSIAQSIEGFLPKGVSLRTLLGGVPFKFYLLTNGTPLLPSGKPDIKKVQSILINHHNEKGPLHIRM